MKVKEVSHVVPKGSPEAPPISLSEIALRRILVPTDFTECSRKALSYALCFARQCGAEILLLHIVESVPAVTQDVVLQSSLLSVALHEESETRLARWEEEAMADTPMRTMMSDGVPWQRVVEIAREKDIDLIVAGTGGRGGLARALLGSTAERIVRHAPCPVLVVREREHDFVASSMESKDESAMSFR